MVAGCSSSGRDFARPQSGSLILGGTSPADAVAAFGEPARQRQEPCDPNFGDNFDSLQPRPAALRRAALKGELERLTYSFTRATLVVLPDQATARIRLLDLAFWKDKLVYYHYSSSFQQDATDFDEAKARKFVRGRTTTSDVLNQLGTPGGQAIYPYIAHPNMRAYFYQYATVGPRKGQVTLKHLELLFNANDRLEQSYLVSEIKDGEG
ncbi:MAG TPA: hypothetical protein VFB13_09815 [Reyranella sp.]|nr:hypothetical protein [Reyranella sp.]